MAEMTLTKLRLRAGLWQGALTGVPKGAEPPAIDAVHLETPVDGVSVTEDAEGSFLVSVPVPASCLSDGVQTVLIRDAGTGTTLSSFTIVTGEPLEDDIRAEVDLLRAELDLLKKAFRRHCVETS